MNNTTDFKGHKFKWAMYLLDIILLIGIFAFLTEYVVEGFGWRNFDSDLRFYQDKTGHLFILLISYVLSVLLFRIRTKELESNLETVIRAFIIVLSTHIIFSISTFIIYITFPGHLVMWSGICCGIIIPCLHLAARNIIVRGRKKPKNTINLVFIGADSNAISLYESFRKGFSTFSYNVLGFFSSTKKDDVPADSRWLGKISEVCKYLSESDSVAEVYCALNPAQSKEDIDRIIKVCEDKFIRFYYVPNMDGYVHRRMNILEFCGVNVIKLHNEPLSDPYSRFMKRSFDIIFSGIFLVTLYPIIWLVVAIITKITSPGPVLFRQARTGYNGKSFTCLKFRSMKINAEADTVQATKDDPRKTKFGDFLRRTSIDELPQFINVFKGDMSIVGPRPHMELHTKVYSELISEYLVRHLCLPGITGWAQINGCRGETKTDEEMEKRVEHDIWYIEHWSMILDIRIILKTILQIIVKDEKAY